MILIDSNILIDVIEADPDWAAWSYDRIVDLSADDELAVDEVVIAEVAPYMASLDNFYSELALLDIGVESIDDEAAFAAGLAFKAFRARRAEAGSKSVLSDFLIGGHAETLGARILTRDPRFYRTYFPGVPLITPSKDEND